MAWPPLMEAGEVADELRAREQALGKLPLTYSLALRLRDTGVAAEVICAYLGVEAESLRGIYRLAEAKLIAAQRALEAGNEQ